MYFWRAYFWYVLLSEKKFGEFPKLVFVLRKPKSTTYLSAEIKLITFSLRSVKYWSKIRVLSMPAVKINKYLVQNRTCASMNELPDNSKDKTV